MRVLFDSSICAKVIEIMVTHELWQPDIPKIGDDELTVLKLAAKNNWGLVSVILVRSNNGDQKIMYFKHA
jgi:hypothetical protein